MGTVPAKRGFLGRLDPIIGGLARLAAFAVAGYLLFRVAVWVDRKNEWGAVIGAAVVGWWAASIAFERGKERGRQIQRDYDNAIARSRDVY